MLPDEKVQKEKDLLETDVFKDIPLLSKNLEKRSFKNKPIESFNKKDWMFFFSNKFKETYGKKMFDIPENDAIMGKVSMMNRPISDVFVDKDWSSLEFSKFLEDQLQESFSKGFEFRIYSFYKEYCSKRISVYDKVFREERLNDDFRRITYHKFYFMNTDNKDGLIEIIDLLGNDFVKIMFSFGLPITYRYIQLKFPNLNPVKIISKTLKEQIIIPYTKKPELVKNYLGSVLTNSVLWGPYKTKEMIDKLIVPDDLVYDWRSDLDFLWKRFDLDKEEIWDESEKYIYWEQLAQVKTMFCKGLKRKRSRK